MEAGLLLCDQVVDHLKVDHGSYLEMYQKFLPDLKLVPYHVHQSTFPDNPFVHDSWIITGSRWSAYDDLSWINKLKDFIVSISSTQSKMVGICFGHQMIGEALGGQVAKAATGWEVGVKSFEIIQGSKFLIPNVKTFNLLMMCQDQVVTLPPDSICLGASGSCPNAMMLVQNQFLGVQGHPEFTKEYDRALMQLRQEKIGTEVFQKGLSSLQLSVDGSLMTRWIMNFLRNEQTLEK